MHAGAGMSRAAVERVPSLMRVVAATGTDDRATRRAFSVARSGTVLDGVGKRNALSVMPRAFRTRPGGLEPPTFGFVDRCSIQLSYGRVSVCIAAGGGEMIAKLPFLGVLNRCLLLDRLCHGRLLVKVRARRGGGLALQLIGKERQGNAPRRKDQRAEPWPHRWNR